MYSISPAVVSSFLYMNAHLGHNHLVPAILINAVEVAFALYDAEHDVIIHILPMKWRERTWLVEWGGSAFVASAALRSLSATVKSLSNKEQSQTSHWSLGRRLMHSGPWSHHQ